MGRIKKGSYLDEDIRDNGNQPTDKIEEEEEDLDTVDTKVEKFLIAGSIVTILILAAAIMFIVVKFVFPNFNKDKDNNPLPTPTDIITEAPSPTETVVPTSPVVTENVSYEPPNVIGMIVEDAKAAFLARILMLNLWYTRNIRMSKRKEKSLPNIHSLPMTQPRAPWLCFISV